jgi:Protein of unknown function (DUF4197)
MVQSLITPGAFALADADVCALADRGRRQSLRWALGWSGGACAGMLQGQVFAQSGPQLSQTDALQGIRLALERGSAAAVSLLGRDDGFLGNPKVRIPLPGLLAEAAKLARLTGQQQKVDELVTAMNRAAEQAVPAAKPLLMDAVKSMTVDDGVRIVRGPEDSVTQFFAGKTRAPLSQRFLPIVTQATERVALAAKYNALASKVANLGLLKGDDANLHRYVTGKALDGLYAVIGDEERKLRQNPAAAGSAILTKVFGALR